jgi:hypothetical protein
MPRSSTVSRSSAHRSPVLRQPSQPSSVPQNSTQPVGQSFGKIMKDSFASGIGFQAGAMMVRSLFPGQTQGQGQGQVDQASSCDDIKRVFNSCLEKAEKSACTEIAYAFNQKDYKKCIEQSE